MPSIAEKLMKDGFERGIEQNQIHTVEKMILNEMSNTDIRKITGVSSHKLEEIRKRLRKHG
jgi:ribosomal protein L10